MENARDCKPVMGAEDFGRFSEGKTPICTYFLGTTSKEKQVIRSQVVKSKAKSVPAFDFTTCDLMT